MLLARRSSFRLQNSGDSLSGAERRRLAQSLIALATAIKVALLGNELEARAATAVRPPERRERANLYQIRKTPTKGRVHPSGGRIQLRWKGREAVSQSGK